METATSSQQLVVFSLGEEEYALPITRVQEIIRYTEPRTVASSAYWIRGVISLRGKIIPVYDLASRLGLPQTGDGEDGKIVIVENGEDRAGVVVNDVEEVLTVESDQVEPVPASGNPAIEGIVKIDERLIVLLDPGALLGASDGGDAASAVAAEALAEAAGDVQASDPEPATA